MPVLIPSIMKMVEKHTFFRYLTIQGALFGAFGLLVDSNRVGSAWIVSIAIFLSFMWYLVMERMKAFIDLRYVQGEQLELKIGVIETIGLELELRRVGKIKIRESQMKLRFHQRFFSISKHVESLLPIFTGIIWIVLALSYGIFA